MSATVERLMVLMEEAAEQSIAIDRASTGPRSIRELGVDSRTLLAFMVAVEDEFGFEWDDELEPETLSSFHELAAFLDGQVPA